MQNKVTLAAALTLLAAGGLRADFTYEETSKITGGAIVGLMKFAGAFSKDARRATDPINSTIAIQGNRMVRKSQLTATITDLDAGTITTINFEKKTYWTMTFAQMKEAMDNAMKQMEQSKAKAAPNASPDAAPNNVDVKFDVKVQDTGQTKPINGIPAHEMILTMTMEGTDQQSGTKGGMNIVTDSWLAPRIPGYEQVHEFYRRMAEKVGWVPSGTGMLNRPDIARGMSEIYKEGSKLDGIPVLQIVKMGGTVEGNPQSQNADGSAQPAPAASSSSSSSSPPPTSLGGALGSALGGRFGLGRKKKDDSQNQTSNSSSGQPSNASGSLMEMTIELTNYSSAPADAGLFAIPAGFKQIEPETMQGRHAR